MTVDPNARHARQSSFGWLLQRLARRVETRMIARLQPLDLPILQFAIIMTVLERPALTQSAIGQDFDVPAYAISRALDGLEARGLVARKASALSRRSFEVHLTEAGRAMAPELMQIVREVNAEATACLDEAERAQLIGLMTRVLTATE